MTAANFAYSAAGALTFGILTGSIARYRGREFLSWFLFGALMSVIAVPIALFAKRPSDPLSKKPGMLPLAIVSGLAIPATIALYVVLSPATLPSCDGYGAERDIKSAVENSPAGKTSGLKIIHLANIRQVAKSANELKCSARARMNTAADIDLRYRFYIEDNELFVEATWTPPEGG